MMSTPAQTRLQLIGISKTFPGGVRANNRVSLSVDRGEVYALLGENGAGKTTLMNVLYGLHPADEGEILLDGKPANIHSAREAIHQKVGMVHQHFMLVPTLTVAENIILGMRPLTAFLTDMKTVERDIANVGQRFGLGINPSAIVSSLSVGEQQRVEIVKALYRGAELLILDEPTAVLTPQEATELFATLRGLVAEGLSIIFITHKLNEVMGVADRVSVMRDGRLISTLMVKDTNQAELAMMMVGREVSFTLDKPPVEPGELVLEAKALTVGDRRGRALLGGVSLLVRQGEILGIAGVDGNGQRQLAGAVTGLRKPDSGRILFDGRDVTGHSPRQLALAGLGHIPEDRYTMGLVLDFSIAYNTILQAYRESPFTRWGLLQPRAIASYARRLVQTFDVRTPSVQVKVAHLSGGNQQKIILGREIDRQPKLLVAVQPTRGLDVGATEYIHTQLLAQRQRGAAILLISTDLEEIMALSDRIAVLYEGRIVGEVPGGRANMQKIGQMMAGHDV